MDLETYIRQRARNLNISLSQLCREAGISRQTLYEAWSLSGKYPSLNTLVNIAYTLKVHPLRLLQLLFGDQELPETIKSIPGDRSAFVGDITYPDGEYVMPGETFTKVWAIQNIGEVAWEGRSLICQDDELIVFSNAGDELCLAQQLIPTEAIIPIPYTPPGQTIEIAAEFTAPDSPGTVMSYWKMVNSEGNFCYSKSKGLWVKVTIITPTRSAQGEILEEE
ncbi:NBR1-Ig-like domain-containing protein [Marinospirillum celere]|nr:NBR1-Ig-like domain-containing protein [Marinospirillum celere]